MDVGKLVDVLDNSLDATKEALEAGDQADQKSIFGIGLLGELK